jgi:hypothetical protein
MTKDVELVEMQWKAADFKAFFPQRSSLKGKYEPGGAS